MNLLKTLHLKAQSNVQLPDDSRTLTSEGQTYFNQVLAQYQLLPPTTKPTDEENELRKFADSIVARKLEERTWADLFALEICTEAFEYLCYRRYWTEITRKATL